MKVRTHQLLHPPFLVGSVLLGTVFVSLVFVSLGFVSSALVAWPWSFACWRRVGVSGLLLVAGVAGALAGIDGPGVDGSVPAASAGPAASGPGWQDGAWTTSGQGATSGCSASAGTFSDDFTTDARLDRDCWSRSGPVLRDVARRLDASLECPQLVFSNGMKMTSGGIGIPEFSGIQSRRPYSAPFQFETTVSGTESGESAFAIYMVGPGLAPVLWVSRGTSPRATGLTTGCGLTREACPAGTGFPGSQDLDRRRRPWALVTPFRFRSTAQASRA